MIKFINKKTQLASAALMTGMMFSSSAHAVTNLETQTEQIGRQINNLPQLINGVFFVAGIGLVGLGLFGVKKHVDSNGQEKLPPALAKAGIGGALLALPFFAENALMTLTGGANTSNLGVDTLNTTIF